MEKETLLFTTTMCSKCPAAKKFMADKGIEYATIEVDTALDGTVLATEYEIQEVPTIVEIDENKNSCTWSFKEYKKKIEEE